MRCTVISLVLLASSAIAQAAGAQSERKAPPNLLIVFPDQMRGQALGFLGEEPVRTPSLDEFARQGLVLTHAVATYPVCSPYRAMLMTGMYPHRNGVLSNCNSNGARFGYELRERDRCWSDVLKDKGYSLGYIGKWHLDSPYTPYVESYNNRPNFAWNEWCPPQRRHGFDYWYAYGTFDRHLTPEYWSTDMTREQRVKVQQWGPEHEADRAIEYLRSARRPFALVVAMNPPHMPYNLVPKRYVEQYADKSADELVVRKNVDLASDSRGARLAQRQTKNYYAMITGVDDQFGRILRALDELGLTQDTIVLFTSDHGNCLGSHEEVSKNNHYEESMRVPFVMRWPGRIPPRHDDLLLSTPDIYPTLLDLMGFGADIPESVEGRSYAKIFRGDPGERPASQLYIKIPVGKPASGNRGVRTHRYTLMIRSDPVGIVLHDNRRDPWQLANAAAQHPEVVRRLVERELLPWLERTGDPWRLPEGLLRQR